MRGVAVQQDVCDVTRYEDMARFDGRGAPSERGDWRRALQGSEYWDWKHYVKLLEVNNIGLPTDLDAD